MKFFQTMALASLLSTSMLSSSTTEAAGLRATTPADANSAIITATPNSHEHRQLFGASSSNDAAKTLIANLSGTIPGVGWMVQSIITVMWPSTSVWDQILDELEAYIDLVIYEFAAGLVSDKLAFLSGKMEDYNEYTIAEREEYIRAALDECEKIAIALKMAVQWPTAEGSWNLHDFSDADLEFNYWLIDFAISFAPIHLGLLKERYMYGADYWDFVDDAHKHTLQLKWRQDFDEFHSLYTDYFEFIKPKYQNWRENNIEFSADVIGGGLGAPGKVIMTIITVTDKVYTDSQCRCKVSESKLYHGDCNGMASTQSAKYMYVRLDESHDVRNYKSSCVAKIVDPLWEPVDTLRSITLPAIELETFAPIDAPIDFLAFP